MTQSSSTKRPRLSEGASIIRTVSAAAILGFASGALMGYADQKGQHSLMWLALLPAWLLLELFLEFAGAGLGARSKSAKAAAPFVLFVSFYLAWFIVRNWR